MPTLHWDKCMYKTKCQPTFFLPVALIQFILLHCLNILWCNYWVLASFLNGLPLWNTISIHLETMLSLILHTKMPESMCLVVLQIHFLQVETGALIHPFTHGLAIKKRLVTLSISAQCNHLTRDKVIITVGVERLKSRWIVQYKLVQGLKGGNGQIITRSEISLPLNLYIASYWKKPLRGIKSMCAHVYSSNSVVHIA